MNDAKSPPLRSPMRGGEQNTNPRDISLWRLLREDFATHDGRLTSPGFWALAVHRLGNARMEVKGPLRAPLSLAYRVGYRSVLALWGIDIPYVVPVGRRLRICHHGGVHMGAWSVGNDVTIRHSVTVGVAGVIERTARSPVIGDRVELGPGAAVIGTVNVGDGAVIGANTLVLEDVAPGAEVIGVPARPRKL